MESAYDYTMALNIKDQETEKLVAEVAEITDEPGDLRRFLETEIWPLIPEEERGRPPMKKSEREEILGYGSEGV